jgi:RNA polymerase primary sigma factor
MIGKALEALPRRERTVISLRFGLFDGEPQSLESVSRIFGVSRERIRQIQSSALARLRDMGLGRQVQQEDEKG